MHEEVNGNCFLHYHVKNSFAVRIMNKILNIKSNGRLVIGYRLSDDMANGQMEKSYTLNKLTTCSTFLALFIAALLIFNISPAWSATISGEVEIEGKEDLSGVLITIQGENLSGVTDRNGLYSISDVSPGSFTIIAQKPGCLVEVHSDVLVGGGTVELNFKLIPGDLKIDNQINLLDRVTLTSVWGAKEGAPNWNSMFDIHEDGVIDNKDKELLLSHWREGNPNIKLGSLEVSSEPPLAKILINGADTGKTTPCIFPGMVTGKYVVTLIVENYAPGEAEVQVKQDEIAVINQILDDQPPEFMDWTLDPPNLTEDTQGRLSVSVRVEDKGGSGLTGKVPQFDYHIGANTTYDGFENMTRKSGDVWYFDIEEPVESWDVHRGKNIYYKARIEDVAGNLGESLEQRELIDDINDPPTARITSTFNIWEKGLVTIEAEASDIDGTITGVKFERSFDNTRWSQIGLTDITPPYSVAWDTIDPERRVIENVWVRATATDDKNASVADSIDTSFAIDNAPPSTIHDYDGLWHNKDFVISLKSNDGNGIGVSKILYILNDGIKQEVTVNGQPSALVNIVMEKVDGHILEFWAEDKLGNEESHKTLSNIRLDKTPPVFSGWEQDPGDLTEDSVGRFRVSVRATDENGSGLTGKIPQIDYHIGSDTQYDVYENMATVDGKLWYFDIPQPAGTWDAYRNQYVFYKIRIEDAAGNERESAEQRELIDDINDPPIADITSRFSIWQKGLLTIGAEASDTDGVITGAQFEYSSDLNTWIPIGPLDISAPFSVEWDTTASIRQAEKVWVRVKVTDDGGASVTSTYPTTIGIDNQPPFTSNNYDNLWHTMDFAILLTADDGNGAGVSLANIKYILNSSVEKNLSNDGHPWINQEGINELEYWSVDDLGNVETRHRLSTIKLDKTPPSFLDWIKDPLDLTEDSTGSLRISVRVMDTAGGSGLAQKVPQFSYRTGKAAQYGQWDNMTRGQTDDVWYYDIPEPVESWNARRGESVYYKVKVSDVAENLTESREQEELINDINDLPTVNITSKSNNWEKGILTIEAQSSDSDGIIIGVQLEYSFNRVAWTPIGNLITFPPYSTQWDTAKSIPGVNKAVWIRATATDDDGGSVEYVIPSSISVDNEAPIVTQDYDGLWHNTNFVIRLQASDREGIGVSSILYRLNSGNTQEVPVTGQPVALVDITTEGPGNTLEYWAVDKLGNEGVHETLSGIKLDKTKPEFSNWQKDPGDLTEDTKGKFRLHVQVTEKGGSGLGGNIPQIDYRIGSDSQYDGFENMSSEDGVTWYFDVPEPTNGWNSHRGQNLFYKVRSVDVAKNVGESSEQTELIDSINDLPIVKITSTFENWVGGQISIDAEASDEDGSIPSVRFEYSFDLNIWTLIGITTATPPDYSVIWDTKTNIPDLARTVWVRAVATDADDKNVFVVNVIPKSFGVDNQVSTLDNWTQSPENLTEDIRGSVRVEVSADDGLGSGVAKVELAYRIGNVIRTSFKEMTQGSDNIWYSEISEPAGTWDRYRGETLYYRAQATDIVGNRSPETLERQDLIDDINDPPRGLITSTYRTWESGDSLLIRASATDDDGQIKSVQFQYSINNVTWVNIGVPLTTAPYTVIWDTTVIDVDPDVWLRAAVSDDDNAQEPTPTITLGIDNRAPVFSNWSHSNLTEDFDDIFRVEVEINDSGSGLDNSQIQIKYRIGTTSSYSDYQNMFKKTGTNNIWFYEIPRPLGNWSNQAGKTLSYIVKAADKAGNTTESLERSELIEPTTGSISGTVTPRECWAKGAKVSVQQNGIEIKQVSVSQIDGSYSITQLRPGKYDLVVTASGYGIDRSITDVNVVAGQISSGYNIQLFTYTVSDITSQGGIVEFSDSKLLISSNTLAGKVVLGFNGREPTSVLNPRVQLLGKAIGVGFQGRKIDREMQLVVSRPTGIVDGKSIMVFIYDRTDYRMVDRDSISQSDTTLTITLDPDDVRNFSDPNHTFTNVLSRTSDTAFYVLITKFEEPQLSSSGLGIINPESPSSLNISSTARRIALLIHGITTDSDDLANMISSLKSMTDNSGVRYYDHILIFKYDASKTLSSNSSSFIFELNKLGSLLPSTFQGKIDVVAHGMGGLIARSAITSGGDSRIGSLIMLGTPHAGANDQLLRSGFAQFLQNTQSDPAWTYYRDGWQDMLEGSYFLANLNSQSGKSVKTHYYGIVSADLHDGLITEASSRFIDNIRFPHFEQPLTEDFAGVTVSAPSIQGPGFMSNTKHVAMVYSPNVIGEVVTYLQGKSGNIRYERYEGEITPGQRTDQFVVEVKNVGTETVYGVSAKLQTASAYIRKYSGAQGIEVDTATLGDIPANGIRTCTFKFDVSSNAAAAIGQLIAFTLTISNSHDNSTSIEEFDVSIGGNLIKIALDQSDKQQINVDVATDSARPTNDGDIAAEPGEIMKLKITLKNNSGSSFSSITATLKTDDTRVTGLNASGNEINLSVTGLTASYGTITGGGSAESLFQLIKIKENFAPLGSKIPFVLDIKSGVNFIGSDTFDIAVGANIAVTEINIDEDLTPGGGPEDIDIRLRNTTDTDLDDVEARLSWTPNVVTVDNRRKDIGSMDSGDTEVITYATSIDDDFSGYVNFTLEIEVNNSLVNIEKFKKYFGMRTHYITNWITDDDDYDSDNDDGDDNTIAQPGERIRMQIARWNPTDELARDITTTLVLDPDDDAIKTITRDDGDYDDILPWATDNEAVESDRAFEFTIADAGNITVSQGSTYLDSTRLEYSSASWIPGAFIDGMLNPNTTSGDPQYQFEIVDNGTNWIEVSSAEDMLDPNGDGMNNSDPQQGDPFKITIDGNTYDLEGYTVEFTLEVTEDDNPVGQETFKLRIGGKIRHLPPAGFSNLMADISDSTSLGPLNNGNGIPEPGEYITIDISMLNIFDDDIDDVEVELDAVEGDVRVLSPDQISYGNMNEGEIETKTYKVAIEDDFEGNIITFTLDIRGRVDGSNENLGRDVFTIPVLYR